MTISRTAVLLPLLISATCSPTTCGQDLLRWKFERGETLNYTVLQKMQTSMSGAEALGTMNQKMSMTWNVLDVAASGDTVMTQIIDRIQVRIENANGVVELDTDRDSVPDNGYLRAMAASFGKIVGTEFQVTMKPTGKIEHVTIPDQLVNAIQSSAAGTAGAMDATAVKDLMRQTAVTLPDRQVSPGDSWQTSQTMELPLVTMIMKPTMTYRGRETGTNLAIIDFAPAVTLEAKQGAPVKVSLKSAEGVGRMKFDLDAGRVQSMQLQMTLVTVSEGQGQVIEESVKQSTSMTLAP